MKTSTLSTNCVHPALARSALLLVSLLLVCFAISPMARAVSPPPDGGYPGNNTAEGTSALLSLTSGINNNALGFQALYHNTTGNNNSAEGFRALYINTTGVENTAVGSQALYVNTTGGDNTAIGFQALYHNTGLNASDNTAIGALALFRNSTGSANTATGAEALTSNTAGHDNTADGGAALHNNTGGYANTAVGSLALSSNQGGFANTAIGADALEGNAVNGNTAIGASALQANGTGVSNTACGSGALLNNASGSHNIALGDGAGRNPSLGSYNIDIGNEGVQTDSHMIRMGAQGTQTATFIAGVYGANEGGTISPVYVNSNGRLGTQAPPSARRFKKEIKSMDSASEALLALKPVTFHYKSDTKDTPQFGLIAEEVAKVNPSLVLLDKEGKPYTVRYEAVNAMLLNEFLKEHRKVQEQEATITQLKQELQATTGRQQKQIEALSAGLQKVSAELEANKPPPQVVAFRDHNINRQKEAVYENYNSTYHL